MESGYIQLPYGYVPDQNPNEKLYFDLPLNYEKSLLFEKLPYIAQLNNQAIDNVVKGKKNDDSSIQKFLLATDLLEDIIQDNLDMIVTDGEWNDAGVRRALDTKFPSVMKKSTATNFMFRDKAKFDIQNPVLGSIYNQLLTKKQKEKEELDAIGKAPSVKDLDIKKRLDNISKFNLGIKDDNDDDDDDDDDDDNDGGNSRLSSLRNSLNATTSFPPTPPTTLSTSTLWQTQRFLLDASDATSAADGGNERVAQAIALTRSSTPVTKQITFSDTITKIFPKTRKMDTISEESSLNSIENDDDEIDIQKIADDYSDISSIIDGLKDGNLPIDLKFFLRWRKK